MAALGELWAWAASIPSLAVEREGVRGCMLGAGSSIADGRKAPCSPSQLLVPALPLLAAAASREALSPCFAISLMRTEPGWGAVPNRASTCIGGQRAVVCWDGVA